MTPLRTVRAALLLGGLAAVAAAFGADALLGGEPGFGPLQTILLAGGAGLCVAALLPPAAMGSLALLAVVGALCIVAAEVVLRATSSDELASIYRMHPRYLHALEPGAQRRVARLPENGGGSVLVRVNSQGFRGPELEPAGAQRRVVVYGDSFVAGEFSALDATFAAQLGARLAEGLGEPVETVNAGVVAYGPDQALLRMQDELGWLAPDLAVLVVFAGNDWGDLLRNKLFRLAEQGELEPHAPELADSVQGAFWRAQLPLVARLSMKALSALTTDRLEPHAQVDADLARSIAEYEDWVVEGNPLVESLLADHYDADLSLRPESDSARFKVALMEAVLERIRATAEAAEVPLFVVIVPSPVDACEDYDLGRVDATRYPDYRPTALTDALEGILARRAIHGLDLWGAFTAGDANALYFHGGDNHWNDAGQALAAELAARSILARELLR